mmetsp:Transcript_38344/g.53238  ORF Transcript_38344/g.53238 Transcript_38344/m.53238 type:complete len:696 (-) Transcript_38344:163-2250(-)|eukprot:CAMPEP_0196592908 /NCGR_PEP_ID=MMETSP1081-20130531/74172_1 /TAXON_ID=36882 /ORGANISM="Pyramimonas amylifera, Strain CCMP720" /LENGTH=695 /DNA_ID=CAMNT_0041916733 /DNA_START=47 /DNA_END=2137 /DNA_ORIENTATION=+
MANLSPHQPNVSLVKGLQLAASALRKNLPDGIQFSIKTLRNDRVFCLFLGSSLLSFSSLASFEMLRLTRLRREAQALGPPRDRRSGAGEAKRKKTKKPVVDTGPKFRAQLVYLLRIVLPSWRSRGNMLLATQFILLVTRTLITVKTTKLSVFFLTNAISQASWKYWVRWVVNFMGWMGMSTMVNSGLKYTESLIALELREKLTQHAHNQYLTANNFYKVAVLQKGGLGNIDQRICADIDTWATNCASLYGHSFKPVLEFVLSLAEASKELGVARPVGLFLSQAVVAGLLRGVAPSLGCMVAGEAQLEGAFRRTHARLIAHAEEIAFLKGSNTERMILNNQLSANMRMRGWYALVRIRKYLNENFAKFQGLLIGGLFVHIPFLTRPGAGEASRISSFRATEELMLRCGSAFVEIVLLNKSLQELAGFTHRIGELFQALEVSKGETEPTRFSNHVEDWAGAGSEGKVIRFEGTSVDTPEPDGRSRRLVTNLQLEVVAGRSVLVTGPNGAGKTSLFRVLAGLWLPVDGTVLCPQERLMWLPQKPYLVMGTLRDQIVYPATLGVDRSKDALILECLEMVGLHKLATQPAGLDLIHEEWNDVLSGGERQRMGFARLYFHRPLFAVLDEATSAINPDEEQKLYQKIEKMHTTVFSIAHRLELRKFHHYELILTGDGSGKWDLIELGNNYKNDTRLISNQEK